ncbi:MAG TPA: GtrA family protein [Acetobacteraceae bacterium]|nr:GtrA family protein [Acetobacteraceae bacterium]
MKPHPGPGVFARLTPEQRLLLRQFLQFAAIGAAGFVWDTAIVYATAPFIGPYAAGIVSFFIVGSINWAANRLWTYRHLTHGAMHRQLVRFLIANAIGFVLNRGTYVVLIATQPLFRSYLVLAVAAGAGAGMFVNFFLSRRLVFR